MTTPVFITVDTELSGSMHGRDASPRANFESSILGRCAAGDFGVGWQMDRLEAHGLTGVYFVDPLPALVYGEAIVADIVGPIVARGHDVQLHIHTEWLQWAKESPVGGRRGRDIADFSRGDQVTLLGLARDLLERAGAPRPTAFRAGNFGANDDTLWALAQIGLRWDSSLNAAHLGDACHITLGAERNMPVEHEGVTELPVSGLIDRPGHFRPAQVCAISAAEMRAALRHAAAADYAAFTIVTHSFEMLSRDRQRPNLAVTGRFEEMCRVIAETPGLTSGTFRDLAPGAPLGPERPRFASNRARTLARVAGQAFATLAYERKLLPA